MHSNSDGISQIHERGVSGKKSTYNLFWQSSQKLLTCSVVSSNSHWLRLRRLGREKQNKKKWREICSLIKAMVSLLDLRGEKQLKQCIQSNSKEFKCTMPPPSFPIERSKVNMLCIVTTKTTDFPNFPLG